MKNIVITGSLAFDYIMDFPQTFEENILPEKLKTLSVSFLVHNFSRNFGGVAGNIGYNLGLLGKNPIILASSGKKDFALYENHLKKSGVKTNYINYIKDDFTANMFMITDKNNCQIAGFYPGAMEKDSELKIKNVKQNQEINFAVIAPTTPKAMDNFVSQAKEFSIPYLYDPAQQIPRINPDELKNGINGAEILIGNDYELALVMKKTGFTKDEILKRVKILITTLGEKGSVIETKNRHTKFDSASRAKIGEVRSRNKFGMTKQVRDDITTFEVGIAKVEKVIDPTGAGDAYIAGFLAGYANKKPLNICGQMGATLSSFAIEQYGTQRHRFTADEFKNRYQQTFKENLDL